MRLRAQVKAEEPYCRSCLVAGKRVATDEIDHIVPLARGGSNARSNMQGLCDPCHKAKSKTEREAARRGA
jgi:5-methylcytosine-specific restriction protein A